MCPITVPTSKRVLMPSEFVNIGQAAFPRGDDIRCSRFEWRSLTPNRHGRFAVRFLSPDGEPGPRRYWAEPRLKVWMEGHHNRFLEQACDYGYKILAELERHDDDARAAYRVARLIFRNRDVGHVRMGRKFRCAADFVDLSRPENPQLILPGLGQEGRPAGQHAATVHATAGALLRQALQAAERDNDRRGRPFEDVLRVYEHFVAEAARATDVEREDVGREDVAGGSGISDLLVVKTIPQPARDTIDEQVRSALIAGPMSAEDFRAVEADEETLRLFLGNLERKALDGCSEKEFDDWLRRVRHEGYLQLVGRRKLQGRQREEAKEKAQRIFCWLLWQSYRMMAKCYGALMALVGLDFALNNKDGEPTEAEQRLFDLEHRQVDFLGGLPIAFLGPAQLRWVVRTLHKLEACLVQGDAARYQATWGAREDAFADIPMLLGIFGGLSRERRTADRQAKGRQRNASCVRIRQAPKDRGLDNLAVASDAGPAENAAGREEPSAPPERLHTTQCPRDGCGVALTVAGPVDLSDPQNAVVDLYCPRCDETARYVIDLNALKA